MNFKDMPYVRPDIEQIEAEFTDRLHGFATASFVDDQLEHWQELNVIRNNWQTQATLCHIRSSMDTTDPFYQTELNYFDEQSPRFAALVAKFYRALLDSKFRSELNAKVGDLIFKIAEQYLTAFNPSIMDLLVQENKLNTEYDLLRSSAKLDLDGKKYTLAGLLPFTTDPERDLRHRAVKLYNKFFADNLNEFNIIFDKMVKVRTEIARKLGYKDYVALGYARMGRLDYGEAEVAAYRKAIIKYIVPLATELRQRQATRLGLEKLTFYDEGLSFPTGNPKPLGNEEELVEKARAMYNQLSPETGEFFNFMISNGLMDLPLRPGKHGGGYCAYIPLYKSPFILANFNGTADDIDVLTHEVGHAFQVYRSRNTILPEYIWPSMDAAEIHSMSMEYLTWNYMKPFFGAATDRYNFEHLATAVLFIPYGALVDHFQHEVYRHPEFTPAERMKTWRKLEKIYLPHRDYADIKILKDGGYWFRQSHIFTLPFYYIDYTLAQNCSLQFWHKGLTNMKAAWQDYMRLCDLGGSKSFAQLVNAAGLENPFRATTLSEIAAQAKKYFENFKEEI